MRDVASDVRRALRHLHLCVWQVEQYTEQLLMQEAACVDSPDDRLDLDSPVIVGRELLNDDEKRELGRRIDAEKERRRRKKRLGGEPRLLEVY